MCTISSIRLSTSNLFRYISYAEDTKNTKQKIYIHADENKNI